MNSSERFAQSHTPLHSASSSGHEIQRQQIVSASRNTEAAVFGNEGATDRPCRPQVQQVERQEPPQRQLQLQAEPDVIWASPPCTKFSVAALGKNWHNNLPRNEETRKAIVLVKRTVNLIKALRPTYFFIENPVGMLRTLGIVPGRRNTITYCQYGEKRRKPTDIWNNYGAWLPRRTCRPGDSCHEASRRGVSNTGTQGLTSAFLRGKLPYELCVEIVDACEVGLSRNHSILDYTDKPEPSAQGVQEVKT